VSEIKDVLVPPRRLGSLLRESRVAAGEELADVAARSGHLTAVDLDELEQGSRAIDDELLAEVVDIYGVDGIDLVPQRSRLVIDLDEGLISADTTQIMVDSPAEPDAVLVRYLALVHRLRGQAVGTKLKIRELDVGVLATALELDEDEIERRLHRLMGDREAVEVSERSMRRRLLVPMAGVVVAVTAVGVLLLVAEDGTGGEGSDPSPLVTNIEAESPALARSVAPVGADGLTAGVIPETDVGDAAVVEGVTPAVALDTAGASVDQPEPTAEATATPEAVGAGTGIGSAAILERGGEQTTRD
jgi:hypothetical protein